MSTRLPEVFEPQLNYLFTSAAQKLGRQLADLGMVLDLTWNPQTYQATAQVRHGVDKLVSVDLELELYRKRWDISEVGCSCGPRGYCAHIAAVLIVLSQRWTTRTGKALKPPPPVAGQPASASPVRAEIQIWLESLARAGGQTSVPEPPPDEVLDRVLYLLRPSTEAARPRSSLRVFTVKARLKKDGGYGRPVEFFLQNCLKVPVARGVRPEDVRVARLAYALTGSLGNSYNPSFNLEVEGDGGAELLRELVRTGRCHWIEANGIRLRLGEPRKGTPAWARDGRGNLIPQLHVVPEAAEIVPFAPPWYIDTTTGEAGPVEATFSKDLLRTWLTAPRFQPFEVDRIHETLKGALTPLALPEPETVPMRTLSGLKPVGALHLTADRLQWWESPWGYQRSGPEGQPLLLAKVTMRYDEHEVDPSSPGKTRQLCTNREMLVIERDRGAEEVLLNRLRTLRLEEAKRVLGPANHERFKGLWTIQGLTEEGLASFFTEGLPKLQAEGWVVTREQGFSLEVCRPSSWYLSTSPAPAHDWFEVELGVRLGEEQINLLPVLLEGLRRGLGDLQPEKLKNRRASEDVLVPLPDGRQIAFPAGRLREILLALVELHSIPALAGEGRLPVHRLRAAQLGELADHPDWAWTASPALEELAKRLRKLDKLPDVVMPGGLQATLRPYQVEGLQWLQFIREFQLGGVLADDMGLGKTVQALAHLVVEKEAGRLDRPCLVVSPTSVLVNWRDELARFATGLKVLTLHGSDRKDRFGEIASSDVVLTTYPLLPRDAAELIKTDFHCVILDEAQNIKNPKTQAAQVVCQLRARHRLCLTGTPLENHLGELWSLFNFLIPGFLGDETRFNGVFRGPIERAGDETRRKHLGRRVRPFLLRRKKDQVAAELPAKTEIVRRVELGGAQRDLYETIRLAMESRVREEVQRVGIGRSHIVILDALLKLRQVCCDPRLVKLESARNVKESAKLELLMELLPTLLEEGRRILLFSQFTSMLTLIEERLKQADIPWLVLTGDTTDRATPVRRFQAGEVPLFLISLKAGGTGLNLTAADAVILYDPWWNPAVEAQAVDRAHRIGQDKPVFVYRLLTEGTVEEKMDQLQARKRELVQALLEEGTGGPTQLQKEDLELLFAPIE